MVDKFGNGSVHGKFDGEVSHQDGKLIVNGQQVAVFNE
jgi:glyceraldehyde-3-phosphate dehydrogenase/erythrose-4-phosphate dehydrogenase